MADLSITAANVKLSTTQAIAEQGILGATMTAGQVVYLDSNQTLQLADCSASVSRNPIGVLLTGGASGDRVYYLKDRTRYITGATMSAYTTYLLSSTAGALMPAADLSTNDYVTPVIFSLSTTLAEIRILDTGVQSA